jgi:hypothetical protein
MRKQIRTYVLSSEESVVINLGNNFLYEFLSLGLELLYILAISGELLAESLEVGLDVS